MGMNNRPLWIRFEDLDALVPGVGDVNPACLVHIDADRFVELPGIEAGRSELGDEVSIRIEDHDPFIAGIDHVNMPGGCPPPQCADPRRLRVAQPGRRSPTS